MRRCNLPQEGTSLGVLNGSETARFWQNLENWITPDADLGVTLRNYGLHMLLSAFVCLFGPWTLALKGATLQFAPGRHLAWCFERLRDRPILAKS